MQIHIGKLADIVHHVVQKYIETNNPTDISQVICEFEPMLQKTCNMAAKFPFIQNDKTIDTYALSDRKRFHRTPIMVGGVTYRVSTQWSYNDEIKNLIKYAAINFGEEIIYTKKEIKSMSSRANITEFDPNAEDISKLTRNIDSLVSFYIAQTHAFWSQSNQTKLSDVKLIIDDQNYRYEVVGRYDLADIYKELLSFIDDENLSDLRCILEEIIEIVRRICELEGIDIGFASEDTFNPNLLRFLTVVEPIITNNEEIGGLEEQLKGLLNKLNRGLKEWGLWKEAIEVGERIKNAVLKVFKRKKKSALLGEFVASDFKIILYKRSIENWVPVADYSKKLLVVYGHELFHAFHFLCMKKKAKWLYEYEDKIVKESLARYIEYRFAMNYLKEPSVTDSFVTSWTDKDMYEYPYSGARLLDKYAGLCEHTFKVSLNSTKRPFKYLESAYEIDKEEQGNFYF